MKKYTSIYAIIIATSILITSCGNKDKKITSDTTPAIFVKTSQVVANSNNSFLAVSGKIQATNSADLSTRFMGYVTKVNVKVGEKVKQGQLLVAINNTDLEAKQAQVNAGITEATVAFNNAEKDYKRFKNLFANSSASQKEMDDITANFNMAKARLEAANQLKNEVNSQFAYANITAPFSGVITRKMVKKGDMANPGKSLISIESLGGFEVMAMVPETEISQIKKNMIVNVSVKSIQKTITGKVSEVSTSAKNSGGQYLVKINLDKTTVNILSGMFATVQFPLKKQAGASKILIPKKVIVTKGQLSGVYTMSQSNTAVLRWLRLGRSYGSNVEVLSGLSVNESYIISAEGKLYNGVNIRIK